MLRRELRLREREAFRRVYEQGRSWGHPLVILYTLPQPPPTKRFGFAVGKSVGQAVARNRVRRRLREIIRALETRIRPGVEMVFTARPAAKDASFRELSAAVEDLLRRARALRVDEGDTAPYTWPAGGRPSRRGCTHLRDTPASAEGPTPAGPRIEKRPLCRRASPDPLKY
ncbi:MAG: ribonuclease P protein component [Armatimonadetes bacterium]|nr:ribonuclease P protein component [Armatimonadota bacterium]